jgi:hypothetical protein
MPPLLTSLCSLAAAATMLVASPAFARKKTGGVALRPETSGLTCSDAARATALWLLKLHSEGDDRGSVEPKVRVVRPVRALKGKGRLAVLEVEGFVDEAECEGGVLYLPKGCGRVGVELVEDGAGR